MPISPNQGPTSGGSTITITGVNLSNAIAVHFDNKLATITANTPTMISVVNPAGNGVAPVTVTTNGGTSNPLNFYYIEFPIITSLSEVSGPTAGGNTIVINGYNLSTAFNVDFGGNSVTPTIISDSILSVVVPAGNNGTVFVIVSTISGTTAALNYSYIETPTIDNVTPNSGSVSGGSAVTISGTNFATLTDVSVGGVSAAFGVINSNTVSIITPAGSPGSADIVVTTTAGSATATDAYTYVNSPGI